MKKISSIIILSLLFLFISCKESKKEIVPNPSDRVYEEVMKIHDEVMPEMGTIHRLRKELRTFQESSNGDDKNILNHIQQLNEADDAMMDWMGELNIPEDEKARFTYLENQLPLIQNVSDKMNTAIADASAMVETLKARNEN